MATSAMPNQSAPVYTQPTAQPNDTDQQYSQRVRLADYASNPCDVNAGRPAVSSYPGSSYNEDGYYSSGRRPVYVHRAVAYEPPVERTYVERSSAPPETVYRTEYRHGRSKKKSLAIVAGTAGVGAAIGAIAGGGKGAAIGGLSGGAAGFAYDRLTHNH